MSAAVALEPENSALMIGFGLARADVCRHAADKAADLTDLTRFFFQLKLMVALAAEPKAARSAYRQAVAHLQATLGMSERRAHAVVGANRTSMR
jgi:hypothetical protein